MKRMTPLILQRNTLKMGIIKKITVLNMTMVILTVGLTACGSFDAEDTPEITEVTTPLPETYEDYIKLAMESYDKQDWETALVFYQSAKELDESREDVYRRMSDVYLQMDDVVQALAILDEGIEKCDLDLASQNALSQRKEYVLAGMVAVRTKFMENEYDDEGNILPIYLLECDENGNEIKSVYYDEEGEMKEAAEYQYDAAGNQTEYKSVYKNKFDESGRFYSDHWTWSYDENGNLIEYAEHDESGNIGERTEHEYDTDGNLIKTTWYDKDGEMEGWAETEYDAAGNAIKYERYNENGSCTRKIIQEYDENGKQTKYIVYDGEGNITEKEEREYDENGNEVKYLRYSDAITINCLYETEYDERGKQIKFVSYDSEGGISYMWEYGYDENGRDVYESISDDDIVLTWEYVYDERGNQIKKILTSYDWEMEQENKAIDEYIYDENENMRKYRRTVYDHEGRVEKSIRWERKYDEYGRETNFYFYDNEKTASYQSETEYDENGLIISYTGYNKKEDDFVRRETEYDESGNVIRESYYDEDNDLVQYYENEYDDFGSVIRQTMYEDGILKSEKQMSYAYRYIGNIDAEAADYMDNEMSPEEYDLKQREIFTRFLNGQEKISYCCNAGSEGYSINGGKIVEETITDFVDFEYVRQDTYTRNYKRGLEYTFLDMTGDGIEELLIRCGGERLCVIQCSYGALKVIYDIAERDFNTYLVKCNGRTGICCAFYIPLGDWSGCCFLDGRGKKEIFLDVFQDEYVDWTEYRMRDNDSFEERDISKGEYYDIMSGVVIKTDIDWQKLEKPLR